MKAEEGRRIHFPAHHTLAPDGARIRYFDTGESKPAIILANGLGGPVSAWRPYIERWRGRYRVLTWDYRGLYGSTLPSRAANLGVVAHADDVRAVLDAAKVEKAAFLGWSMGVQVGLEFYSRNPKRLSHLTLVSGTYGRPLHGVPLPFSGLALPPLVRSAQRVHGLGRRFLTGLSRNRHSFNLLRRLGLIAEGFDRARFLEMVRDFEQVDLHVYLELLARLHEHDAQAHLTEVRVPTLVVAGARDMLTPRWLAQEMVDKIAGAQLFVVPHGTHYCAAEYPTLVSKRVERFLSEPSPSPFPTRADLPLPPPPLTLPAPTHGKARPRHR